MSTFIRASLISVFILGVSCLSACGGTADIRPDELRTSAPDPQDAQRARQLVQKMTRFHGIDAWKTYNFMQARSQDEWFNAMFWKLGAPYSENPERAFVSSYTQQFPRARVEFLGGENRGEIWGVNGEAITKKSAEGDVERFSQQDEGFFASFVHNFLLWPNVPFYLASVDQFAYLGQEQWRGRTFDKVLLSWGSLEPQGDVDQWELWLDAETARLERVWFTVRMAGENQQGGYELSQFEQIQGMQIATIYEGFLSRDDEEPLHTYTYSEIVFSRRAEVDLMATVE